MKTSLEDRLIVELLKKHNLFDDINLEDKHAKGVIHPEDRDVVPFVMELLLKFLPIMTIKDVFYGMNEYQLGWSTLYSYSQIENAITLYNNLQNKFPLYEIGFKRCSRKQIQSLIEKEFDTKFKRIGTCKKFGKITYDLLEEPKYGVLLSITNDDCYTGLIAEGFNFTHEIAKLMHRELNSSEIEFPYNRYGAVAISEFISEKNEDTEIKTTKTPKVKLLLDKWNKENS